MDCHGGQLFACHSHIPFRVRASHPKQPPYRGLVRMEGTYAGKVFMVDRWERIGRDFGAEDLESLLKKGLRLSKEELEKILEGLEKPRLIDVIDIAHKNGPDWEKAVIKLEDILGQERGDLVARGIDRLVRDIASDQVRSYFESRGLGGAFDYPGYAAIVDFLKYRARRRNKTVAALLQEDPYLLVHVPDLLSREDLLRIAVALDKGKVKSARRVLGIINALLWRELEDGHIYGEQKVLYKETFARFARLYEQEKGHKLTDEVKNNLSTLINKVMFRLEDERTNPDNSLFAVGKKGGNEPKLLYFEGLFFAELKTAEYLAGILENHSSNIGLKPGDLINQGKIISAEMGLKWKEELEDFLYSVATKKITLLDGEAGSGKSTAIAVLARAYRALTGKEPFLVAPTGIAAQRAAQKAGISKYATIHRFAGIAEADKDFAALELRNAIPSKEREDSKLIIVDEAGMMDILMLHRLLFRSLDGQESCHFVFVGDSAQLPAVGPGSVFKMLIALGDSFPGAIGRYRLTRVERQSGGSNILSFARAVREGDLQEVERKLERASRGELPGIELVDCNSEDVLEKAIEYALKAFQKEEGDVLLLTPRKQGNLRTQNDLGAITLNERLKGLLNPGSLAGTGLSAGDPVICIKNDYSREDFSEEDWKRMSPQIRFAQKYRARRPTIFNGMRGIVKGLERQEDDEETIVITYALPDGEKVEAHYYPDETGRYLALAYALTIHKAQGGEAKEVIVAASDAGGFGRELLYTAITRAREKLTLIGPKSLWINMAQVTDSPRRSRLVERVLKKLPRKAPTEPNEPIDPPSFVQ